jgi:hypothetical protein
MKDRLPGLYEKLIQINPSPSEEGSGQCLACASETARVLIQGKTYQPQPLSEDSAGSEYDKDGYPEHADIRTYDRDSEEFFDDLFDNKKTPPGSVLIINTEDHDFNIFKTNEGTLFLLDSDHQIFKPIKEVSDLEVEIDGEKYNYFYDREDDETLLKVFPMKSLASENWNEVPVKKELSEAKKPSFFDHAMTKKSPGGSSSTPPSPK